jgi:homoserine dehydrogenase
MERIKIGLVGYGTVGASFYRLLGSNSEELTRRIGVTIEVPYIGVRDASRPRSGIRAGTRLVAGYREILDDPSVPIVVELAGGTESPLALIRDALMRGKHVITANKALLALHGAELFNLARQKGVELKFEAAVCGGIPIVKILQESLLGNRIRSILGIVNGTTNYILTRMTEEKLPYAEALRQAQVQGFAEADPSLDVSGGDAAQKISLLASLAFGCWVDYRSILYEGITGVTLKDIEFCLASGFVFKLAAQARMMPSPPEAGTTIDTSRQTREARMDGRPLVSVFPALVPHEHPLASIRGEFNGVLVDSDFLGPSVYEGRGAGGNPTASSVASDLGDLVKTIKSRASPSSHQTISACRELYPVEAMRSRYYFHFITANRPGIWALVTGVCAESGINIESVHQKWEDKKLPSDLFVLVDEAEESQVRSAFAKILSSPGIHPESSYFRVLSMPGEEPS